MYKLFLCLRYLRSRIIAYFAVIAVALCVAMMLIVVSVMNGFLNKIELAAKGLFGDVVVDSTTLSGVGFYDEFIDEVTREVEEVEACSPFILTFGILRVVGDLDHRQMVQIAGIRLPEQAAVTDFAEGLRFQRGIRSPTFDPPIELLIKGIDEESEATAAILKRESEGVGEGDVLPESKTKLIRNLKGAIGGWQRPGREILEWAKRYQAPLREVRRKLDAALAKAGDERTEEIERLEEELDALREESGIMSPSNRIILGLGLPALSLRTKQGETVRFMVPGHKVELLLAPLGERLGTTDITPSRGVFTVIDDCLTDVSSIDSEMVYVPFDTLQTLNNMGPRFSAEDNRLLVPPRCSQIQIRVKPEFANGAELERVAERINEVWAGFERRHPEAAGMNVQAITWRRRQAKVIEPIEKQRTLTVTMFGIMSLVSVVLIFVIFYTIVVQKTRDIGVMKAIGASSGGVAQIFLAYGAMIGLVGSIIGCIGGYYFVRYINPIQDALDDWFGFRVWSREWFLFEKIPNEVDPLTAAIIMIGAIAAGLVGAILPAIRAARMQPVEALRYE